MKQTQERIEELFQGLLREAAESEVKAGYVVIGKAQALPDEDPELILDLIDRTELQIQKALDDWNEGRIPDALLAHRARLLSGVDSYLIARLKHYNDEEPERLLIDWESLNPEAEEPRPELWPKDFPVDAGAAIAGLDFGRLHVFGTIGRYKNGGLICLCRCDCGKWTLARQDALLAGRVKSCGCYKRDRALKHGGVGSRLYTIWKSMKERCETPSASSYKHYGGRGISVCEEWRNDFEAFSAWAMANGYEDGLTIDRKEVDGDYTPENCRWATVKEQAQNTRQNVRIPYKGELLVVAEAARRSGIPVSTLRNRIRKNPEAAEAELYAPAQQGKRTDLRGKP